MHSELNLPCPYKVFRIEEDDSLAHYEFTTDSGISYYINFITSNFLSDIIPQENEFNFSFGPKSDGNHHDEGVKLTIIEVIKFFFNKRENVLLFTCDSRDGKEMPRKRLFSKWHDSYSKTSGTIKVDTVIKDRDPEKDSYHCSLIIRQDHPNIDECLKAFQEMEAYLIS